MKRLRFHTPDENGKTKCHVMHVGKQNSPCHKLLVHGTTMQQVDSDDYLGDVISNDGSHHKNIQKRIGRGVGKISEVMNILENVSLGKHYFRISIVLRESLFLNSVLTNGEAWYSLSKDNTESLENVDKSLLRKILNTGRNTPIPMLYLELGCMRIQTILKCKRINFLHYIIKSDSEKSLHRFFKIQWMFPDKNDWTETVKQDLKDFDIENDLENFKTHSKEKFNKFVKNRAKEYEMRYFYKTKSQLSKIRNLQNKTLGRHISR